MTASFRTDLDDHLPLAGGGELPPDAPLAVASALFVESRMRAGTGANTLTAFAADLALLAEALGPGTAVSSIGEEDIERFRHYLSEERDAPCSPRTLRRRLTSAQALFRFLAEAGAVTANPVATVAEADSKPKKRPTSPVLRSEETAQLLTAGRELAQEGDPRALLLIALLLSTGLSKSECLALRVEDFDLEEDSFRVGGGLKERVLPLSSLARQALLAHLERDTEKRGKLFNCTGRNLEYVLSRAGDRAGLSRHPSFRRLRATAAAGLYSDGLDSEAISSKLGISPHTWPALRRRLRARPEEATSDC